MLLPFNNNLFIINKNEKKLDGFDSIVPAFMNWKDIAAALSKDFSGFICLLLVGDDEKSQNLLTMISSKWVEIDIKTGSHLILFAPAFMPPSNTYKIEPNHPLAQNKALIKKNAELYWRSKFSGDDSQLFTFSRELSYEYIKMTGERIDLPSFVVLEFRRSENEVDAYYIDGTSFELPSFSEASAIVESLEGLGKIASKAIKKKKNRLEYFKKHVEYDLLHGLSTKKDIQSLESFINKIIELRDKLIKILPK